MEFRNNNRNEFWRTEDPTRTIEFIKAGLNKLGLREKVKVSQSSDYLWSARIEIPAIRASANGKGTSEIAAVASAYAEIVERISAGMETGIEIGPYRNLHGEKGDLLAQVTLYKYMKGYRWGHQDSLGDTVRSEDLLAEYKFTTGQLDRLKFRSELMRHWVSGYSLVHNKEVKVPILFVKWISSTNGLAAGNTIEEAIIHGTCEIFEREALIRHLLKYDTHRRSVIIDPETIKDKEIQNMLEYFANNNIEVVIKYIGGGFYPVYAVMTFNNSLKPSDVGYNMIKAGSSFNTTEAIKRCFTERMQGTSFNAEAAQGKIADFDASGKFMPLFFKGICPMNLKQFNSGTVEAFEDLKMSSGTLEELDRCVDIVERLGTDLIFIDHTHPIINFPVARVIIPGMSDFIKWWEPKKATLNLIGNLEPEEDAYEEELMRILRTFLPHKKLGKSARNRSRRDT
jgi:ribosomal protein S12 methylthiotransferase accessory factor